MRRPTTDPRIERLQASWLGLDREDATWLATVADEADVPAGAVLGHHRFAHVVLTGPQAGLVVAAGASAVALEQTATVLAMAPRDLDELHRRHAAVVGVTAPTPLAVVRPAV